MSGRRTLVWSVDIDRQPEDVFAYLVDIRRHGEWSLRPFRVENVSSDALAEGTTFTSYGSIPGDKQHRNDVEVSEVDPPRRLVLRSKETNGEVFVNTFTVAPSEGGSRVRREMDMPTPGGLTGALFPVLLRAYIWPNVQKGMNLFKRNLESPAAVRGE